MNEVPSDCRQPRAPGFDTCRGHAHRERKYTKAELIMRAKLEHPRDPKKAVMLQEWIEENL